MGAKDGYFVGNGVGAKDGYFVGASVAKQAAKVETQPRLSQQYTSGQ